MITLKEYDEKKLNQQMKLFEIRKKIIDYLKEQAPQVRNERIGYYKALINAQDVFNEFDSALYSLVKGHE